MPDQKRMSLDELQNRKAAQEAIEELEELEDIIQSARDRVASRLGDINLKEKRKALKSILDENSQNKVQQRVKAIRKFMNRGQ